MTRNERTQARRIRELEADLEVLQARCATLEKWIAQLRVARDGREAIAELDRRVWEEVEK